MAAVLAAEPPDQAGHDRLGWVAPQRRPVLLRPGRALRGRPGGPLRDLRPRARPAALFDLLPRLARRELRRQLAQQPLLLLLQKVLPRLQPLLLLPLLPLLRLQPLLLLPLLPLLRLQLLLQLPLLRLQLLLQLLLLRPQLLQLLLVLRPQLLQLLLVLRLHLLPLMHHAVPARRGRAFRRDDRRRRLVRRRGQGAAAGLYVLVRPGAVWRDEREAGAAAEPAAVVARECDDDRGGGGERGGREEAVAKALGDGPARVGVEGAGDQGTWGGGAGGVWVPRLAVLVGAFPMICMQAAHCR